MILSDAYREQEDRSLVDWADGVLQLPQSVRYPVFMVQEAPWLAEIARAISDDKVRRVDVRAPAGSAKSLLGELQIAFLLDNSPGTYYYVWQSEDDARDAMEDRVIPMIEGNDFLAKRMPTERAKKRVLKISFPGMPFYAVGANRSAAQSKRVKYLTMEEPHLYAPGMMGAFEKRCEGVRGAKIVTLSTGSVLDDESDTTFNEGTCEEWEVACPHCGAYQAMTDAKERLKADRSPDTVDAEGNFIWPKLLATVRYNCEACGLDWNRGEDIDKDTEMRRIQSQGGRYRATNVNAKPDHRSFHLEASSVFWIRLEDIVEEKLKATYAARRGSLDPLREYIQKRRAKAWDESPPDEAVDMGKIKGLYLKRSAHEGEISRFLTADNQAGRASKGEGAHRWAICRSYGERESRLQEEGRITTWEELEELRLKLGVLPQKTLVDCAWDTENVQAACVRYGWQALWGDNTNKKSFPHHEMVNGQRIVRQLPFSTVQIGHVGLGSKGMLRQARYFFWCGQPVKNLYHRLRDGLCAYKWTVADDTSGDYFKHTAAEYKKQELDSAGVKRWVWTSPPSKPNHLLDADQMNLVAAMLDPKIRLLLMSFVDEIQTVPAESV